MVTRGRLQGIFYAGHRKVLFKIIEAKTYGTDAWLLISQFKATHDGRGAYLTLKGQYLGEDVQMIMLRTAEDALRRMSFDNRNRNFTFDSFIARMREAFENMGEANQFTEERKVLKLLDAWNVSALSHVSTTISNDPLLRSSFDRTVIFLAKELSGLKTKNATRNVSAITTQPTQDSERERTIAELKTKLKEAQKKLRKKSGREKSDEQTPTQANAAKRPTKFSKRNPGAYVSMGAWQKMTAEEKAAAREARKQKGIKVRTASALERASPPKPDPTTAAFKKAARAEIDKAIKAATLVPVKEVDPTQGKLNAKTDAEKLEFDRKNAKPAATLNRDPRAAARLFQAPQNPAATQREKTYANKTKSLLRNAPKKS